MTKTIIYMHRPQVHQKEIPSIRWHVNKKGACRHGSDCAHFVSWNCSSLSQICTISQLGFFAFQRVHSSAQQREQRLRMRSLEFRHASAAFRLCGHYRGRHIALRMNSSMIGTSRADFLSSCGKSSSNASNKPLESMTSALRIVVSWIFYADHMRHHGCERSTRSSLR